MCLKECGLTKLETSRLKGDQIKEFKILNGYDNIDTDAFFFGSMKIESLEDIKLH